MSTTNLTVNTGRSLEPVKGITFAPNGQWIGAIYHNGLVIWDLETGLELLFIKAPYPSSGRRKDVVITPDNQQILTSYGEHIGVWDIATGKEIHTFQGHQSRVESIAVSPDGQFLASGAYGGGEKDCLKLWNMNTGKEVEAFREGMSVSGVSAVAFSPDGQFIISLEVRNIIVRERITGKTVLTFNFQNPLGYLESLAISADGQYLVSQNAGRRVNTLSLWNFLTGQEQVDFFRPVHFQAGTCCVAITPDNQYVISGGYDATINIFDIKTGYEVYHLVERHPSAIITVAISPDGKFIVSGQWRSDTLTLWNFETGQEIRTFGKYVTPISALAISPHGQFIVSGNHRDKTLKVWDTITHRQVCTFSGHPNMVNSIDISPDNQFAISGSTGIKTYVDFPAASYFTENCHAMVKLWEITTGKEIYSLEQHTGDIEAVSFSPKGQFIVFLEDNILEDNILEDNILKLWDMARGKEIFSLIESEEYNFRSHDGKTRALAFSPDGTLLVSGGRGGNDIDSTRQINLWDVATGQKICSFPGHHNGISTLAISPNKKFIVSGGYDYKSAKKRKESGMKEETEIKLWDISTGRQILAFVGHTEGVNVVAITSDGKYLISGSDDKTLRIWELHTGEQLHCFRREDFKAIHTLAISRNNQWIVFGDQEGIIRLWSLQTGQEVVRYIAFRDGEWISITPQGTYQASSHAEKYLLKNEATR